MAASHRGAAEIGVPVMVRQPRLYFPGVTCHVFPQRPGAESGVAKAEITFRNLTFSDCSYARLTIADLKKTHVRCHPRVRES
jgi:hypothetical protein